MTRDEIILHYAKELGEARRLLSDYHDRVERARNVVSQIEGEFSGIFTHVQRAERYLTEVLENEAYDEIVAA